MNNSSNRFLLGTKSMKDKLLKRCDTSLTANGYDLTCYETLEIAYELRYDFEIKFESSFNNQGVYFQVSDAGYFCMYDSDDNSFMCVCEVYGDFIKSKFKVKSYYPVANHIIPKK